MSVAHLPDKAETRPIPGFDGYRVARDGTVYGLCGFALTPTRSGRVGLYTGGKQTRHPIAALVAAAWSRPSEADPGPEEPRAPQPAADDLRLELDLLREAVATLEADLASITRQRDKALRQRDALAVTRLIEVAQPRPRARVVRQ